jgi:hypothetical protein
MHADKLLPPDLHQDSAYSKSFSTIAPFKLVTRKRPGETKMTVVPGNRADSVSATPERRSLLDNVAGIG